MKQTTLTLKAAKNEGRKISMLTCYDYSTARLVDKAGVDTILVGDSLGMVMLGYENTLSVTMEDMIHHSAAVARGAENSFVITDMPFMSYQVSVEQAVINAGRLVKEGYAEAIKLEGGVKVAEKIRAIVDCGIPVVGHIGMTPQSVNEFGGFKVQGKDIKAAEAIIEDALAVEKAGACMVVLECVPAKLAAMITSKLTIPTIGIGAGNGCDGQVLVYHDMIGMFPELVPRFAKCYDNIGTKMIDAFKDYDEEVKSGAFPPVEKDFKIDDEVIDKLKWSMKWK